MYGSVKHDNNLKPQLPCTCHAVDGRDSSPSRRHVCRGDRTKALRAQTSLRRAAPHHAAAFCPSPRVAGLGSQVGEHEELEGDGGAQQSRDRDGLG